MLTKKVFLTYTLFVLLLLSLVLLITGCERGKEDLRSLENKVISYGEILVKSTVKQFGALQIVQVEIINTHGVPGAVSFALFNEKGEMGNIGSVGEMIYQYTKGQGLKLLAFNHQNQVVAEALVKAQDYKGYLPLVPPKDSYRLDFLITDFPLTGTHHEVLALYGLPTSNLEGDVPLLTLKGTFGLFLMDDIAYDFDLAYQEEEHFDRIFEEKLQEKDFSLGELDLYFRMPHTTSFLDAKTGDPIDRELAIHILLEINDFYYDAFHYPYGEVLVQGEMVGEEYHYQVTLHQVNALEGAGFFAVFDREQKEAFGGTIEGFTTEDTLSLYILEDYIVEFVDANLEDCIRDIIDRPEGPIYRQEVLGIEVMDASSRGIASLEGIGYLENLKDLTLNGNLLTQIGPLQELSQLEILSMNHNQVENLLPLENLNQLVELRLVGNQISSLIPLQGLTQLKELYLGSNEVQDISNLEHLVNLEKLGLGNNEVTDISVLEYLDNLKWLEMHENQIIHIWALEYLVQLESLDCSNNFITDIYPLVMNEGFGPGDTMDLRYNYLDLTDSSANWENIQELEERGVIVKYDPQQDFAILTMEKTGEGIIEPEEGTYYYETGKLVELTAAPKEEWLFLEWEGPVDDPQNPKTTVLMDENKTVKAIFVSYDQYIVEFQDEKLEAVIRETLEKPEGPIYFSDVLTIEVLEAGERQIESLGGIEYLHNMIELQLFSNQLTDILPLQDLTKLEILSLFSNQLTDISPLQNLTNLTQLEFIQNQVADLSPLQGLTQLQYLDFAQNQVADLSPLQGLIQLKGLDFRENQVEDIEPLQNLVELEILWFSYNQVEDIKVLQGLTQLEWLDINHNQLTDLAALVDNVGIGANDYVDVRNNYLNLTPGSANFFQILALMNREVIVLYEPQRSPDPSSIP